MRLPARPGAPRAPVAERDLAELREFARDELGLAELQAWDLAFASEKLKEQRYAFSDQEVKQYFTEPKVLDGLFRIVETLFEVRIRPDTRAGLAPERALLPHRARRRSWSASSTSTPTRATASGRAPGWTTCAAAGARPDGRRCRRRWRTWSATSRRRCGGTPGAADARRRDHAVPRVRPRPAPHADARRRPRRVRHLRRRVGRGRAAEPVHGELLLGMGRAAAPDRARRHRRAAAARAVRQDARGEELPERPADAAPGRVRAVRHAAARRAGQRRRAIQQVLDEVRARGRGAARRRRSTASSTASRTSSPAAMRPATTATSGPRCCRPTPGAPSRNGTAARARRRDRPALPREILEAGGSRTALESFKAFRGREPRIDALLRHQGLTGTDRAGSGLAEAPRA